MALSITHKYDDIIDKDYPYRGRPIAGYDRMSTDDRAKIFMPFAALRGYAESIEEQTDLHLFDTEHEIESTE